MRAFWYHVKEIFLNANNAFITRERLFFNGEICCIHIFAGVLLRVLRELYCVNFGIKINPVVAWLEAHAGAKVATLTR
jgi:hypothetical protein